MSEIIAEHLKDHDKIEIYEMMTAGLIQLPSGCITDDAAKTPEIKASTGHLIPRDAFLNCRITEKWFCIHKNSRELAPSFR